MQHQHNIWRLMVRQLENSLTEEEARILHDWLNESEENRHSFNTVKTIWKATDVAGQGAFLEDLNLLDDWNQIQNKIEEKERKEKITRLKRYRALKKRQIMQSALLKVAAIVMVAFLSAYVTYLYAPNQDLSEYEPVYRIISTNAGERANVDLGDGTRITLNAESRVEVPDVFTGSERFVKASGQVFFDVEKDEDRPFYVETSTATVRVLGTSFDVRSYEDEDEIRVVVSEGVVELSSNNDPDQSVVINRGHMGSMDNDAGRIQLEPVNDLDMYTGWLQGRLVFEDVIFEKALANIRRWFNVNVDYELSDPMLLQKAFTADLKMRSVESVFNAISVSMNVEYRYNDEENTITLIN